MKTNLRSLAARAAAALAAARRRASTLLAALLLGGATVAQATPIVYTMEVVGGNTTGTLGGVPISEGLVTITFTGDTRDIIPYSVPNVTTAGNTTGYILLKGTATLYIYDLANNAQYSTEFLPSAGIYVSLDTTHNSVGFGSFGVPPTDAAFPGPVAYPEGFLGNTTGPWATWDMTTNLAWQTGYAISCSNFPVSCASPGPALPTAMGDLILNQQSIALAYFEAQLQQAPFAALTGRVSVSGLTTRSNFNLSGSLTLNAAGSPFNPVTDAFSIELGPYQASLPAGSFRTRSDGSFAFSGSILGNLLTIHLVPGTAGNYTFTVATTRVDLTGLVDPAPLTLTFGANTGTANIPVAVRHHK
jgi:hypothetical protein